MQRSFFLIDIINKCEGPKSEPWGLPMSTFPASHIGTYCFLIWRYDLRQLNMILLTPLGLCSSTEVSWSIVSITSSKSQDKLELNITATDSHYPIIQEMHFSCAAFYPNLSWTKVWTFSVCMNNYSFVRTKQFFLNRTLIVTIFYIYD